jgi:Bacterial membrane flanked domain.
MGYIEQSLTQGEQIRYHTKLHWVIFIFPVFLIVIGFCLAFVFSLHSAALIVGTLFFLVGILLGVPRFIAYKTSEFAVTNKRVLIKVGFIKRHSLELLLQKVEGIGVDQDISGRIFGYGTIIVTGTGGTKEPFKKIANPLEFRKQVQQSLSP